MEDTVVNVGKPNDFLSLFFGSKEMYSETHVERNHILDTWFKSPEGGMSFSQKWFELCGKMEREFLTKHAIDGLFAFIERMKDIKIYRLKKVTPIIEFSVYDSQGNGIKSKPVFIDSTLEMYTGKDLTDRVVSDVIDNIHRTIHNLCSDLFQSANFDNSLLNQFGKYPVITIATDPVLYYLLNLEKNPYNGDKYIIKMCSVDDPRFKNKIFIGIKDGLGNSIGEIEKYDREEVVVIGETETVPYLSFNLILPILGKLTIDLNGYSLDVIQNHVLPK